MLRWTRRLAALGGFGYAVAEIGAAVRPLPRRLRRAAQAGLAGGAGLPGHHRAADARARSPGASARADGADRRAGGAAQPPRRAVWHLIAIFYLVALWLVWALEVQNGFSRLLRVVIVDRRRRRVARLLAIAAMARWTARLRVSPDTRERHPGLEARLRSYHPIARALLTTAHRRVGRGRRCFRPGGSTLSRWFDQRRLGGAARRRARHHRRHAGARAGGVGTGQCRDPAPSRRLAREAQAARSARLRTLLPMLRTTLLVAICWSPG